MNNVKATVNTSGTLTVSTGITKTLRNGERVRDSKTGRTVTFQGKVNRPNLKHPFMFLDSESLATRRHSAAYIAKYIG